MCGKAATTIAAPFCDSVRVHLDGSPSEEVVDDRAREMAKAQLDKNAARGAANRARELAEITAKGA
jgi:sRNA-binding protein